MYNRPHKHTHTERKLDGAATRLRRVARILGRGGGGNKSRVEKEIV